ncbi:cytochrome b561 and DOMON domain-containing-like protein [Cinnamomum micranthum f. kanehirae]|uniref:Cytochrome b561 and DOMON domain-containing-like protein n=1 Tax=Cinnamomum micranthum f. kanehirae TaxID=337451 RepID=A0A3S3M2A5_9MAGN|nr:cytochrome b561 and DOMON domain-containing-like protein [Cinnamomum micranthum f. kanehirae]
MKISFPSISFLFFFFLCLSSFVNSQSDSCNSNLNLNIGLVPFNTTSLNCHSVWTARDFILRYKQSGPNLWSFVLSAPDPSSYIAIGFSPNGQMVGSSAIVGWISQNGTGVVKQYSLTGKSERLVIPDQGSLQLVDGSTTIVPQSSRLYMAFQLNTSRPQSRVIYSIGPSNVVPSANNILSQHQDKISTQINYATGQSSSQVPYTTLRRTHGILNMVGWGILMPIGSSVARFCKHWDPAWFYSHVSIQGLGFGMGIAAVILGFRLENKISAKVSTHKALGILILSMGCLQVLAFLLRPDKDSKARKYWTWYHQFVGRALIMVAIGNIFYGISLGKEGHSWYIGYGVVLGVWVLVASYFEVKMCCLKK